MFIKKNWHILITLIPIVIIIIYIYLCTSQKIKPIELWIGARAFESQAKWIMSNVHEMFEPITILYTLLIIITDLRQVFN